ncbi:MAG: TPR repeat-containing glycosyl transferase [Nitrosomonas europaea]|nr:MAG: TPR repeat-containing glycosyl transferase [Nitrosomonas europaea]
MTQTTAFPSTSKQQKLKKITDIAIQAEQLQEQGNIEGAIQLYRQWLEHTHSGDKWIAQFNLGVLLKDSGNFAGARQAFQSVLQQRPDFVQARKALELLHDHQLKNGLYETATGTPTSISQKDLVAS